MHFPLAKLPRFSLFCLAMFPSCGPVYNIPPPGFIARNYNQRPREQFSLEARQLLFSFAKDSACPSGHVNAPSVPHSKIPSDTDRYYEA
jgi:hypothetical protein